MTPIHATVMTVHIVAGALGLLAGFVALYASKGANAHRASGSLFVYSMVTMAVLGAAMAAIWGPAASTNVPAGLLTTYLVITGMNTVARPRSGWRWFEIALMLVALGVSLSMLSIGAGAIAKGGTGGWMAVPAFIFTTIGALGTAGDLRVLRSGPLTGGPRLARHLWRSARNRVAVVQRAAAKDPSRCAAPSGHLCAADAHGARDDVLLAVASALKTSAAWRAESI